MNSQTRLLLGVAMLAAGLFFTFVMHTGRVWFGLMIVGGLWIARSLTSGPRR